MPITELLVLAVAVSADAFAVALTRGVAMPRFDWRRALVIATCFGFFQALMPLVGWLLGSTIAAHVNAYAHWIALGLLTLIGGRMIVEALSAKPQDDHGRRSGFLALVVLAVATSIDALAVGVSLAVLPVNITAAVAVIGATTLVLSFIAVIIGNRVGNRLGKPAEIIGGLVLIAIGIKITLDHFAVFG